MSHSKIAKTTSKPIIKARSTGPSRKPPSGTVTSSTSTSTSSRRRPAPRVSAGQPRKPKQDEQGPENPNDLPLFRREGFAAWARGERTPKPPVLTRAQLETLSPRDRARYAEARNTWHSNLTIKTADVARITSELAICVGANRQHHSRMRPAVAIDGYSHLGKTTILQAYAKQLYLDRVVLLGDTLPDGSEHIPVCFVTLNAKASIKAFNRLLCRFYGLPVRGATDDLTVAIRNAINRAKTAAIIVDDIHFATPKNNDGRLLSNHLKNLAAELGAVTWIFAGIDVRSTGLLDGEKGRAGSSNAQTGRRTTRLQINPYTCDGDPSDDWHQLLAHIEQNLVLVNHRPGTLHDVALYLHRRTGGYIGGLMNLINKACYLAIQDRTERITKELLEQVRIDDVSEQAYRGRDRGRA